MLVVRVEIHPGGDSSHAREIDTLYVWNISALADESDYLYRWSSRPSPEDTVADGLIIGHRRSDGAWELVRKILQTEYTYDEDVRSDGQ